MHAIQKDLEEFRGQLGKGSIQKAYRALLTYMMGLRTHLTRRYPVSSLYQGSMDMTYFALVPPSLKRRGLKIAVVFNYDAFRFEAWLVGRNRQVQRQYWKLFKDSRWPEYRVVTPETDIDWFVQCVLAKKVDLAAPEALTSTIEKATVKFIADMERYLAGPQPDPETEPRGRAMR